MYTGDLENIIACHGLTSYCYANDCQVYFYCKPNEIDDLGQRMVTCIQEISEWMSSNRLKLNPTKTEFLWAATNRRQHLIDNSPISVTSADIVPSTCVKLLGVYIDSDLSMTSQINRTISSCFFQLRQIRAIRRNLPVDATKSLVNAFVVSRLDYCNGLYANLHMNQLNRLQSVLHAAARLIFGTSKFSHITPLIRDHLHWLRIPERINYKLCLMVFKALQGMAPSYITELCQLASTAEHDTRSSNKKRLYVPRHTTKFGDRAFCIAGPTAWNSLPADVRICSSLQTFKTKLKTHFFQKSYKLEQC